MSAPRQLWSDLAGERSTRHEDVNAVRVTSYAGVKEMLRDFRSFSNRFGTVDPGQELPVEDQILAFAGPPRHSRQRKLLTAALSASRVERLHEAMQQTVDGLIDAIIASGSPDFELISSLASPFPALTTAELMGVPYELRERFAYYSHLAELSTAMPGVYDAELAQWSGLIEELVRQRRAVGRGGSDDLIATMCFGETDGQRFSDCEVGQMVQLVNSAGNTTTTTLISNIVYALDEFPEQKKLFLSDIDGLVDSAVEEGLRYDGPIQGPGRLSQCPAQVQGYDIQEGERVFGSYAAASHDPEIYERVQPGFAPEAVPGWTFRGWMGMMAGPGYRCRIEGRKRGCRRVSRPSPALASRPRGRSTARRPHSSPPRRCGWPSRTPGSVSGTWTACLSRPA